ncbi:hypothetical protein ABFS82_14G318400 [Erythranthe guttata]|uniref:putative proteasome subunit alpha type-4-B n=1 Tax=Erythranthe guttata TaxID=4155 RepID=UPI00064D998F|nr:PREDICTED: putative proteasome subunit alpha type-4-B [Erythranthe guttata]|eukprot:XP_012853293.1 PREDICTED: putative proteasome subunit alpha type-4-B [Erythranthe guttata]
MYKIDDHVTCAVAGILSDANILINTSRLSCPQKRQSLLNNWSNHYATPNKATHSLVGLESRFYSRAGIKVLSKTMDSTSINSEKRELAEIFLSSGNVKFRICPSDNLNKLLVESGLNQPSSADV